MSLMNQVNRFFQALNEQDRDTIVAMISPQADVRTPIGSFTGGEAYWEWIAPQFAAVPDFYHEQRGIAVEVGNRIGFELHATGTFTAPLALGPGQVAQPTGNHIDMSAADLFEFDAEGRISKYHLYFDGMEFLRQLGLAEAQQEPASAQAVAA